ncbi:MAG TPA: zinc ribbon domain-containing protein [Solirubrobacteraceae bacterium]|nr:zinc ribbon domain-containing protein [Solirubrobacteraceae bacterium]
MPIYEYRRPDGTTFEIQQSFSDEPLSVDPDTGVPVERVLHPPAVHFKGKGFYNTDYGTRNRQRETAAAAAAASSPEGEKASGEKASEKASGEKSSSEKSSSEGSSSEKSAGDGASSQAKSENGAAKRAGGSKPVSTKT